MSTTHTDVVRVAIIGSGLTGLVAAYLLTADMQSSKPNRRIHVDLFERASTLGMDSASISVPLSLDPSEHVDTKLESRIELDKTRNTQMLRIDVPMRAFTGGYYPQLLSLYRYLGIQIGRCNFTYSFAFTSQNDDNLQQSNTALLPTLLYNGANGLRGISLPRTQYRQIQTYLAQHVFIIFHYLYLLIIALWHHHLGHTRNPAHPIYRMTFRQLCQDPFPTFNGNPSLQVRLFCWIIQLILFPIRLLILPFSGTLGLSESFVASTVVPLFSAVMTCSTESVWQSPATEILDYIALTFAQDHFIVKDGVRNVVKPLLCHLTRDRDRGRVWTLAEVKKIQKRNDKVWLTVFHHDSQQNQPDQDVDCQTLVGEHSHGPYEHIIFATQANQSARFLSEYLSTLSTRNSHLEQVLEKLQTIKYEKSIVVNHTDQRVLSCHKSDWRDLNFVSPCASHSSSSSSSSSSSTSSDTLLTSTDELSSCSCSSSSSTSQSIHSFIPTTCHHHHQTMATHLIISNPLILQTTNPLLHYYPHPTCILSQSFFQRAVLDVSSHLARLSFFLPTPPSSSSNNKKKGKEISLGPLQIFPFWFTGSWCFGIPLFEGCVVSASLVSQNILQLEGFTSSSGWSLPT